MSFPVLFCLLIAVAWIATGTFWTGVFQIVLAIIMAGIVVMFCGDRLPKRVRGDTLLLEAIWLITAIAVFANPKVSLICIGLTVVIILILKRVVWKLNK